MWVRRVVFVLVVLALLGAWQQSGGTPLDFVEQSVSAGWETVSRILEAL